MLQFPFYSAQHRQEHVQNSQTDLLSYFDKVKASEYMVGEMLAMMGLWLFRTFFRPGCERQ